MIFQSMGNKKEKIKEISRRFGINNIEKTLIMRYDLILKAHTCPHGATSIGVGHTGGVKEGDEITLEKAMDLFWIDRKEAIHNCRTIFGKEWVLLNRVRQDTLAELMFSLGVNKFKHLKKLIKAIKHEDWENAWLHCAYEIHRNKIVKNEYHEEVGERAKEMALELLTGKAKKMSL